MPWRSFVFWNAAGGISWAVTVGLAAYWIGDKIGAIIRDAGLVALVVVVFLGAGVWHLHRRRAL